MERKLKCAIVDDDPEAHVMIMEILKNSPVCEITHSFYKPSDLLDVIHTISIDVIFLDIVFVNDTIQGFDIAPILIGENKTIIFISGKDKFIIEACKYAGAIDVVPKPTTCERLVSAVVKAWKLLSTNELNDKTHELFYIAERKEQISLYLPDFLFIKTPFGDPRNKELIMKNGDKITLMDCKFSKLLKLSHKLAQINISEIISYDILDGVFNDTVLIKPNTPSEIPRVLTLSKTYRQNFKANIL
jgi:DNA-binding LytR/AlgR family response regulator